MTINNGTGSWRRRRSSAIQSMSGGKTTPAAIKKMRPALIDENGFKSFQREVFML